MNKKLALTIILSVAFLVSFVQSKETEVVAIKGARIIPVVGEEIPQGVILIKGSKIEAVGTEVLIPDGARVVDASGLKAYPGMIDGFSFLGLMEISTIRATVDVRETGDINPQALAFEALRPDSMHIPIARANGITASLVCPSGGLIAGQSGLIKLDGWTPGEMIIKAPVAMHIEFPSIRARTRRGGSADTEPASKQIEELKELFKEARYYQNRREYAKQNLLLPLPNFDLKLESLLPVIQGELPVIISVHAEKDIKDVINFVNEEKLDAILFGVTEGWKVVDEIAEAGFPVIMGTLTAMPPKWEDGYDALYRLPSYLQKAGVKIAFSSQSASLAKDFPYQAAKAAAFGLPKEEALKAVTLYPAQIFGVAHLMGSLEKDKLANIVLCDGDILELRTSIKHVFIEGQEVDLANRYTELLEKYKKR
ncbi:MAG: amidohydrolase family protein [Acidobacteriota bacterium]